MISFNTVTRPPISGAPVRVLWFVTHPIQYQVPVFRVLATVPEVDLEVVYLRHAGGEPKFDKEFGHSFEWDIPLRDGYRWSFCCSQQVSLLGLWTDVKALRRLLKDSGAEVVVISGWGQKRYLEVVAAVRLLGMPNVFLSESTLEDHPRSSLRRLGKRLFFRFLTAKRDHALASGIRSRNYLISAAGFSPSCVHPYPYCANTEITDSAWNHYDELRSSSRMRLGIPNGRLVYLFVGKLIRKKNPVGLIRAFLMADLDADLILVGSGELAAAVHKAAKADTRIHIVGFVNQTDLCRYYAASDVVVLPSIASETWGVVINEAMAMGCAAVVSDRVGCVDDLIRGKDTGLVFDPVDDCALVRALVSSANPSQVSHWRSNARAVVLAHTPQRAAEGVRIAVTAAAKSNGEIR